MKSSLSYMIQCLQRAGLKPSKRTCVQWPNRRGAIRIDMKTGKAVKA